MIKPKLITLTRAEGWTPRDGMLHKTATTWSGADAILRDWSITAPKGGSYDKCDFKILFEDGYSYEGRYDLKHHSVEPPSLGRHVSAFVLYHAGTPPNHIATRRDLRASYDAEIAANPERTASAKAWLATYATVDDDDGLTFEERVAIRTYALQHGPDWKDRLRADWMEARTTGVLHRLRNTRGPSWLSTFTLTKEPTDARLPG